MYKLATYMQQIFIHSVNITDLFLVYSGVGSYCCACFGQGSDPIHIDGISCSGSEYRLSNCRYDMYPYDEEYHSEDWSAYCDAG